MSGKNAELHWEVKQENPILITFLFKLKTSDKINEIIKKITHIENNLKNINTKYDEIDKNI